MGSIKAGIVGGAGYTGGELIRILLEHPGAELSFVHSKSNAGNPLYSVHKDLLGETEQLFAGELGTNIDVLFLCLGHGDSKTFLEEQQLPEHISIIDLSQDFRLHRKKHNFIYGLPEINREDIRQAKHIANPGCFATTLQLAVLPLAAQGALKDDVHVSAITGSTGAGQKLSATSHFSWRNNNISVYKAFRHQHLHEIRESIQGLQPAFDQDFNFIPIRGDFTRGILASTHLKTELSEEELKSCFEDFYKDHPFTHVAPENPDLKQVVNTNKGIVYVQKEDNYAHIVSITDNLLKGASGQAVQNMNLMFGLPETEGLKLKASFF